MTDQTDRTDTSTHRMGGELPAGGDRIGGAFGQSPSLEAWYPQRLRVELLHRNGVAADPLGPDFDYAAAFATIDLAQLKREITTLLTTSVDWWPADCGPSLTASATTSRTTTAPSRPASLPSRCSSTGRT